MTAAVGHFLSNIVNTGFSSALGALGLVALVGQDADTVFTSIADALSPEGADLESVAARRAVEEVLDKLCERIIQDDEDLSALDRMTDEDVSWAIKECVVAYVYERWIGELGSRIEGGAISPENAVALEEQMRDFVRESVEIDLSDTSVLAIDWNGEEGREIVERLFQEAYSFLEASEE